jgi:FkbH-like protein
MWYLAGNPFSALGEKKITEKMLQLIRPARIPSKKCLVLDLDGTLWGGVIGEDGVNGIKLDRYGQNSRYYDFQREILKIHDKGILLAIASKNNPEDVEDAFKHPCMLLRKEHFSAIIANWQPKSDSMKQIAEMLKIGIDSLVFVDDNPVEREEVRQNSSEVTIADFPEDTSLLSEFSIELYDKYFYSWTLTNEDLQKTRMYADNKKREESKKTFANLDDFLKDMNIKMSVQRVDDSTVARAFQLIYKTNQFNLTTRRYTESEIAQMISDPNILFLIGSVKDRFGDNGYTILCVAIIESETEAKLDSFLMSCRIMGRKIEFSFLKEVESMLATMGVDTILAEYIPSNKNLPCRNFYNDAGYNEVSEFKYTLQRTIINN